MSERTTTRDHASVEPPPRGTDEAPKDDEEESSDDRTSPEHRRARQTFVRGLRDIERWGFDAQASLVAQRSALAQARVPERAEAHDIEAYIAGCALVDDGLTLATGISAALLAAPSLLDPRTVATATRLFAPTRDVTPDLLPWITQVLQRCARIREMTHILLEECGQLEQRLVAWESEQLDDVVATAAIAAHVSATLPRFVVADLEAEVDRRADTWRDLFRSKRSRERRRLRRFAEAGLWASIERGARPIAVAPLPDLACSDALAKLGRARGPWMR